MKIRTAALAAAVVSVALAAPAAEAAPRRAAPVCNLVVDEKNDVTIPDGSLDVVSADIATDSKRLTGVFRLAGAPDATSPGSATGRIYRMQFEGTKSTAPVFLTFIKAPNAQAATYGYYDATTRFNMGLGEAQLKIKGNELYMTVPIGVFAEYGKFKPGNTISGLTVTTGRMAGVFASTEAYLYNSLPADSGTASKGYKAGSRSCVKIGG